MDTNKYLNPNWDLSLLYSGFEDTMFTEDFIQSETALSKIFSLLTLKNELTSIYLLDCLKQMDDAFLLLNKITSYVNLTLMVESSNVKALSYSEKISKLNINSHECLSLFRKKVGKLENIDELIGECEQLKPYKYLLQESYNMSKHRASDKSEEIILKMQLTGGYSWQKLRDSLDGAALVNVKINNDNTILTLPEIRALASDPDGDIRQSAYEAELASYKLYDVPMSACLSAIKGEALTTVQLRGYESVLDYMIDINKMDYETLNTMMDSIKSYLPVFHKYLKTKSNLLGHKNGLPWYDLLAPISKNSKLLSYEEAAIYLTSTFNNFDENMGSFINHAFSNRWIDAFPKEGKLGGALCADLLSLKENRIFANFNGSYSNINTLAHELGHAFHSRCLDDVPPVMRDAPTPICETASLFNETVFQEQALNDEMLNDNLFLLEASLNEITQTVVDIYSRFLFEDEVFKRRKDHALTSAELCEIMSNSQLIAYGDSLDPNFLHPYMWMCKVHYYIPEFHYYNFPYIFGLLFAKGLYFRYLNQPLNFMTEYVDLLKSTCTDNLFDIAAKSCIDIHSREFWDNSLKMIEKNINKFIELTEEL